jgi:hypothetical protein
MDRIDSIVIPNENVFVFETTGDEVLILPSVPTI